MVRPHVADGRTHSRCSSALEGRSLLSLITLRLCLSCFRAERAHALHKRLRELCACAAQALEQTAADCRQKDTIQWQALIGALEAWSQ